MLLAKTVDVQYQKRMMLFWFLIGRLKIENSKIQHVTKPEHYELETSRFSESEQLDLRVKYRQ